MERPDGGCDESERQPVLPRRKRFVFGTNVTLRPDMYATVNYTEFTTNNANPLGLTQGNIVGRFLTTGTHYRSKAGYEFGFSFAPWKYTDKLPARWGSTQP